MADEFLRNRLYQYGANSNLVLDSERDRRSRNEPTGEVTSLAPHVKQIKMGDRFRELRDTESTATKRQRLETEEDQTDKSLKPKKNNFLKASVLDTADELDIDAYRPRSKESQVAYEELIVEVKSLLGDQPRDVLLGAANDLLEILKDASSVTGYNKEKEVASMFSLPSIPNFHSLVSISNRITDYKISEDSTKNENGETMDEDVAVIFDEDDDELQLEMEDEEEEEAEEEEDHGSRLANIEGYENENKEDLSDVKVHSIDAYWLQRQLAKYYSDPTTCSQLSEEVLDILKLKDERMCENKLVVLLDFDKFDLIKLLIKNRFKIYYCILLKRSKNEEEKEMIEKEMENDDERDGKFILALLKGDSKTEKNSILKKTSDENHDEESKYAVKHEKIINLEDYQFNEGGHLMTNASCILPDKSWRAQKKGYEEVHVPAPKPVIASDEELVSLDSLPSWMAPAFEGVRYFNRVQSKMAKFCLNDDRNILLCAPTGSGKTNVAMLCMMGLISKFRNEIENESSNPFRLNEFKIVYIAPMKALVQECVQNFSKKLAPFDIKVNELSGDQSLTQAQINETNIIVTTPEKWDIVTRKGGDRAYTQLVKLIIIDEIHLLHDERGPVLEAIVARTQRLMESSNDKIRIVGLSATLPNYEDVAAFLRVDPKEGLFFFDSSYRPVPLQQQFIGITEKKALKRLQLMNEICYEKCLLHAGKNQILIFTSSRADTVKTAKSLRDMALENDTISKFIRDNSASSEILRVESANAKNSDLQDVLKHGFAFHHAGLSRADRTLVEDLFADKHVQVLVSTATLAWGVNLPCHTVILKGTQMYSPELGKWVELSPLDVMQMMGRAGRFGLDTEGEGIILTNHSELQYYLSLMNQQLPIESQLVKKLPDLLNAEIVAGTITNLKEAANWLGYTYLFIRMIRNPKLYGLDPEEISKDPILSQRRIDFAHAAALVLEKNDLIKYDRRSGLFQSTYLGRISSYYYITNESISLYKENLKPSMSEVDILRLFSLSAEFKHVHVREEEKLELSKLIQKVPIPIKETVEEPSSKVNVLLQAYISRLSLEGFALASDMIFIQQSACRLMRALHEMALQKGWAYLTNKLLDLCIMVERRIWGSQSPLRQFTAIPEVIIRKLERISDISFDKYYDLKPQDLGELVKIPKMGKTLYKFVHMIPKLEVDAQAYPITRSLLEIELTLKSNFEYNDQIHGPQILFWIYVEDGDGNKLLHYEPVMVYQRKQKEWEHTTKFNVQLFDPLPPLYFIRVVSDRWLHSTTMIPISFKHLLLPDKYYPATEVLDLKPLPVSTLGKIPKSTLFSNFEYLNQFQTQTYYSLYESDDNVFVSVPTGSGKTVCAELALLRFLNNNEGKCFYISPNLEFCFSIFAKWNDVLENHYNKTLGMLTGDTNNDLAILKQCDVIISTPKFYDNLSRKWKQRRALHSVKLFIFDELHLIGLPDGGSTYEIIVSRSRFMATQLETQIRFVGLSHSIANAKEFGDWLGVQKNSLFNFSPDSRPGLVNFIVQGLDNINCQQRLSSMSKLVYNVIARNDLKPSIIFVPNRKQAQLTAVDLFSYAQANSNLNFGINVPHDLDEKVLMKEIKDNSIVQMILNGIAYIHEGLQRSELLAIEDLFDRRIVSIIIVPYELSYSLSISSSQVFIMDTVKYDAKEDRYIDLTMFDIWAMSGRVYSQESEEASNCYVFCQSNKKISVARYLHESFPIESNLDQNLHDHFISEIVTKTIENKSDAVDYLTWTFYYRALPKNPNYYNLTGVSFRHLSDHLSDLVESVTNDLEESKIIAVENEMDLIPLNLGMISSFYYINYSTIEMFASALTKKTKLKGLIEIISASTEFTKIPVRRGELKTLKYLQMYGKIGISIEDSEILSHKVVCLLNGHVSRIPLTYELISDLKIVLEMTPKLIMALVDVIASQGWLKPALAAMELSQFLIQGLWDKDSPLLQIPHFTQELIDSFDSDSISSVFDIIDMEDSDRTKLLKTFTKSQQSDIARFCNSYPSIEMEYSTSFDSSVETGSDISISIVLNRDIEEVDEDTGRVFSLRYPHPKLENYWLAIGDLESNTLFSIKRVTLGASTKAKLEFQAPETPGKYNLNLYLMCDSYIGCDQEYEITLNVV